jgi:hypothetical protein
MPIDGLVYALPLSNIPLTPKTRHMYLPKCLGLKQCLLLRFCATKCMKKSNTGSTTNSELVKNLYLSHSRPGSIRQNKNRKNFLRQSQAVCIAKSVTGWKRRIPSGGKLHNRNYAVIITWQNIFNIAHKFSLSLSLSLYPHTLQFNTF